MPSVSKRSIVFLKVTIGIFLLAMVLRWIDFSALRTVNLNPVWFAPAVICTALVFLLKILRWRSVLRIGFHHDLPMRDGLAIILIGQLFAFVSPARAGDFIRAGYLRKRLGLKRAASSVIIDMLWDLVAMLLLSFAALVFFRDQILRALGLGSVTVFSFYSALLMGLFLVLLTTWFVFVHDHAILERLGTLGRKVADALQILRSAFSPSSVAYQGLLSILNWTFTALASYYSILALGLEAQVIPVILVMSLQSLLMLIPITVSGIGLREGTSYLLYPIIGIPADLAVPLVWLATFILSVVPALIGGVLYFWYREDVPKDSAA